jgi:hypothetical protein
LVPSDVLESPAVGYQHGLVFIDTVDGEAPRLDNLGTLVLDTDYFEGLLVVQGHVVLRPRASGRSVPALSPSTGGDELVGCESAGPTIRHPRQWGGISRWHHHARTV